MTLRPVSKSIPILAPIIVKSKRLRRHLLTNTKIYQLNKINEEEIKKFQRIFKHKSLLRRQLGSRNPDLQEKKIVNLQIAVQFFNQIIIPSQKIFSFWHILGQPKVEHGYVEGMLLSNGQVITGVGGGLCQLANLLYWIFLHSPLQIIEHHHHQFDVFPDSGRILPFGSGASVFFNYIDLQVKNITNQDFLLKVWMDKHFLYGELLTDKRWPFSYSIQEEDHYFYRKKDTQDVFRKNKLYKVQIDKTTGKFVRKELITKNNSLVLYPVEEQLLLKI